MNELELFNGERDFYDDTMTIKELSEILGCSRDSIERAIKKEMPGMMRKGKTTRLDEMQVTCIKLIIQADNNFRQVAEVKTNLEKALIIQQAAKFQQEIIDSISIENKQLKIENNKMKPKEIMYDKFMDSEELYEIATVAKMIRGNVGRNKLKKWMKDNKIIMNNNDPYQNHKSHVRIIPKQTPNKNIYMQPFLTTAGVKYILDNYND